MKIIGVGMGRTGTTSIQRALTTLGYHAYNAEAVIKHQHFADWIKLFNGETDDPDWATLFDGYNATIAWPACFFYRELMTAYPEARFILTTRDPETWADSMLRNLRVLDGLGDFRFIPRVRGLMAYLDALVQNVFGGKPDRERAIAAFERHNRTVQKEIPAQSLLIYQVQQGWEPLCAFLDQPMPDIPFPHENTSGDFEQFVYKLLGIKK